MSSYIIRRIFYGILVIIAVVCTIASIIYLSPVDPARLSFGQLSDAGTVESKRRELGLDKPLSIQLLYYLRDLSPIQLIDKNSSLLTKYKYVSLYPGTKKTLILKWPNLRESYQSGRPVADILADAIPITLILAITSMIFASLFGIFLGILAAVRRGTWVESSALVLSTIGYSLPSYAAGIFIAILFAYILHGFTGLNLTGSIIELNDEGEKILVLKNLILPAIALGLRPVSIITQLTRAAMLDNFSMPYVRTAFAKGLSMQKITYGHVFKNALNPIITGISGWFASLISGAYFVENVFNFRGLGSVTVQALLNFDIPVVLGTVLFTCIMFVIINVVVDILYAITNPKVRLA
jgi:peptide/nickel transport system permease protein